MQECTRLSSWLQEPLLSLNENSKSINHIKNYLRNPQSLTLTFLATECKMKSWKLKSYSGAYLLVQTGTEILTSVIKTGIYIFLVHRNGWALSVSNWGQCFADKRTSEEALEVQYLLIFFLFSKWYFLPLAQEKGT